MSTPDEQARALVWAGGFLIELARDNGLSLATRRRAATIARHFPTIEEISYPSPFQPGTASPGVSMSVDLTEWARSYEHGPLTYSTRIAWPEDKD